MPITPDGPASYPTYEGVVSSDGGTSQIRVQFVSFSDNEMVDDATVQSLVDHLNTWPDLDSMSFSKIEHANNTVTPTP